MIKRYFIDGADGRIYFFNRHELDYPEPKRARRIRDKQRKKARVRNIAKHCWNSNLDYWRSGQDYYNWLKQCEQLADNLAHCQKPCCNKRRFYEGPPIQERRWNVSLC